MSGLGGRVLPAERERKYATLVDAYKGGLSQEAVAAKFGVSVWSVRNALAKADALPTREEAERRRLEAATSPGAIAKRSNANRRPLADRFGSKYVEKSNGCWEWIGAKDSKGYGQLRIGGRNRLATHVALELSGCLRPSGKQCALHSCDNPPCVNPDHLRWGTQQENVRDAIDRGRADLSGLELGRNR